MLVVSIMISKLEQQLLSSVLSSYALFTTTSVLELVKILTIRFRESIAVLPNLDVTYALVTNSVTFCSDILTLSSPEKKWSVRQGLILLFAYSS